MKKCKHFKKLKLLLLSKLLVVVVVIINIVFLFNLTKAKI